MSSVLRSETIKPGIGSKVLMTKEELLSGEYSSQIRVLLEERGVLVFPALNFTDEEQLAFTRTLGTVSKEKTGEEVFTVSVDPEKSSGAAYLKGSFYWHFDGTVQDKPVLASLLTAKTLSDTGGDTEFCNTYAAFEALPEAERAELEQLRTRHSTWSSLFYFDPEPDQAMLEMFLQAGDKELPLVWTHASGRKSLVLGCTAYHVVGKTPKDSVTLLNRLREWATSEPFHYRHQWTVGDMVIWDNTGTLHRAMPYPVDSGREMRRTKLEGEEPIS